MGQFRHPNVILLVGVVTISTYSVHVFIPLFSFHCCFNCLFVCLFFSFYYIHFEITGDPCNLIGSQQYDLFPNRTIFFSKSHLFQIASFIF